MTAAEQVQIIEEVAANIGGELYENYSGRGMYGAKCLGIECDDPVRAIEEAAARGLRGSCQDHLGKDYIVYWPHIRRP
jgi:hypothetical protein